MAEGGGGALSDPAQRSQAQAPGHAEGGIGRQQGGVAPSQQGGVAPSPQGAAGEELGDHVDAAAALVLPALEALRHKRVRVCVSEHAVGQSPS